MPLEFCEPLRGLILRLTTCCDRESGPDLRGRLNGARQVGESRIVWHVCITMQESSHESTPSCLEPPLAAAIIGIE